MLTGQSEVCLSVHSPYCLQCGVFSVGLYNHSCCGVYRHFVIKTCLNQILSQNATLTTVIVHNIYG